MSERMEALPGQIIDIIRALTGAFSPIDQRGLKAFPQLLLLLIEHLLGHFFPGKTEVADHRYHPQTHGAARREQEPPTVRVVILFGEERGGGMMGQITCRENMWQIDSATP